MKSKLAALILALLVLSIGCSANDTPSSPPISQRTAGPQSISSILGADGRNHFLWMYSEILIREDNSYDVTPVRQATTHWNVLSWLENGPCSNCFRLTSVSVTPKGTLQLSIEIRHPFGSPNLTGFDVRGIAMGWGTHTFPVSGLVTTDRKAQETELVNADGHTTLYNPSTIGSGPGGLQGYIQGKHATIPYPNSTLNGYLRHISPGAANTRNAMYAGSAVTRIYEIYKPIGSFIVGYAVDASWAPPTKKPVTDPMLDFPPEANCPEPWKIDVTETPVGFGLTSQGGQVVLTIDVYDYQGKLSHYAPSLECPELFDGQFFAAYKSSVTGYATFEATVENEKLAPDGMYKCLISVEDTENDGSPDWLDLTAYRVHELGVGAQAPPNVEGFSVSDGDPDLPNRKVELTWEAGSDQVEWYDIERLDFEWPAGWTWKQVKSAPHPEISWIDGNPRYCGPLDPIQYRISARNAAGSSPGYATDTGYPKPRQFGLALWCVADDASGSNPVTSWERATADFNDANTFWNPYGMVFVLKNPGGFLWVGDPQYKSITEQEADAMHNAYGLVLQPDCVNVYYVNSANGDPARAYCRAVCPGEFYDTENVYIVISRDSRGVPPNETPVVLAHELGHAVGHFWDVYLLDSNWNLVLDDGTSCVTTNTWCTEAPYDDPLFCHVAAAYQQNPDAFNKNPWNLMWYSAAGKSIANYNLIDTQYVYLHDWVHTHQSNYPWP